MSFARIATFLGSCIALLLFIGGAIFGGLHAYLNSQQESIASQFQHEIKALSEYDCELAESYWVQHTPRQNTLHLKERQAWIEHHKQLLGTLRDNTQAKAKMMSERLTHLGEKHALLTGFTDSYAVNPHVIPSYLPKKIEEIHASLSNQDTHITGLQAGDQVLQAFEEKIDTEIEKLITLAKNEKVALMNRVQRAETYYKKRYRSWPAKSTVADIKTRLIGKDYNHLSELTAQMDDIEQNDFLPNYLAELQRRRTWKSQEQAKWKRRGYSPPIAPYGSGTWKQIMVDINSQQIFAYEDGELIKSAFITSGRRDFETVRGHFAIYDKVRGKTLKSPFEEEEHQYELWVDYWMPFYGAYGIHDTCNSKDCWRTSYGYRDYHSAGSHGCVNTPYETVRFLFNWAHVGTPVRVK